MLATQEITLRVIYPIETEEEQHKTRTHVLEIAPINAEENTVYCFRNLFLSCRLRASNFKEPGDLPP